MKTIQKAASGALKLCISIAVVIVGPAMAAPPPSPTAFPISDKSFKCTTKLTHVRHFYVDNLAGNLDGTVKVAQAGTGNYPVGSVLQLVPNEVMVKREKGFNATTRDWEFFDLNLTPDGSTIRARGFQEVNNRFGGNCFTCHVKARAEFDFGVRQQPRLRSHSHHACHERSLRNAPILAARTHLVSAEDAAALESARSHRQGAGAASAPKPGP